MDWSVVLWLLAAEALYVRALRVLGRRGVAIPRSQVWCWHGGLTLQAIALLSPLGAYDDELLSAHMAEHLLLADLGAPLLLAGLRTPVLQFFLPPAVLVPLARRRRLRAVLRTLRRPLVAIPVYVLVLYGWHVGPLFEAAVRLPLVHALQHASFVATGVLVWWAAVEPNRRRLRGELWKIGHILGARMAGMFLGMAFVITRAPVYTGVYGSGERALGLDAVADQQTAGAMMVMVDVGIMAFALGFFFWRAAQAEDRRVAEEAGGAQPPAATLTRR